MNLSHYNYCKPSTWFGHLLWPSSGRWFFEIFITKQPRPGSHWIWGWVDPRMGLDSAGKRKVFATTGNRPL